MLPQTAVKADRFVPIGSSEMNSSLVSPGYWASQPEPPANPSDRANRREGRVEVGGRLGGGWGHLISMRKTNKKVCICEEEVPECSDEEREAVRDLDRRREKGAKVTEGCTCSSLSLYCCCFFWEIGCSRSSFGLSCTSQGIASPFVMSRRTLTPGSVVPLPVIFATSQARRFFQFVDFPCPSPPPCWRCGSVSQSILVVSRSTDLLKAANRELSVALSQGPGRVGTFFAMAKGKPGNVTKFCKIIKKKVEFLYINKWNLTVPITN